MATIFADPVGRQTEALSKGQTPAVQAAAFSGAGEGGYSSVGSGGGADAVSSWEMRKRLNHRWESNLI